MFYFYHQKSKTINKQIVFGFFILFYLLKSMKMRQSKQKAKNMLLVLIVT